MAFEWLDLFHRRRAKDARYAERALSAYRLGMKARGPVEGVVIAVGPDCCAEAKGLDPLQVYDPSSAPRLPLGACELGPSCRCAYRPAMRFPPEES